MKRITFFALALSCLVALAVIPGKAAPLALDEPTPTPHPASETGPLLFPVEKQPDFSLGPDDFLPGFNPLTGLPVADPALLERRPIAIKVTNYPRYVRPQPGLSLADVVYEYYMEEGISRFIAIYYGQDASKVGPVRSGRLFDEHVFNMYNAIFVFGYADELVMEHYYTQGQAALTGFALEGKVAEFHDCAADASYPLCRDRSLETYNNLFADTRALGPAVVENGGTNSAPDLSGMYFAADHPRDGSSAQSIFVRYSLLIYAKWEFDPDAARYLRSQEVIGYEDTRIEKYDDLTDSLTGQQIGADNIVVLFVPHHYYKKTGSTEIIQIDLVDSGTATVFRDGLAYPAVWVRPPEGGVLNLFTLDGQPFPLKPGQTWYEVMSLESTVAQSYDEWRFVFATPEVPDEKIYPPTVTPAP